MALPNWERDDLRVELEARIARTKRSKLFEEYRFLVEHTLSWDSLANLAKAMTYNDDLTDSEKDDLGDLINRRDSDLRPAMREKIGGS